MSIDWSKAPEGTTGAMVANFESISRGGKTYKGKVEFIPFDEPRRDCYAEGPDGWTYYPAPTPWNGEGLPPVGTVCEVDFCGSWQQCEIIAHFKQRCGMVAAFTVCSTRSGAKSLDAFGSKSFRPLRTPEQIAAEERLSVISEIINIACSASGITIAQARKVAEHLHEANYRKQVKP